MGEGLLDLLAGGGAEIGGFGHGGRLAEAAERSKNNGRGGPAPGFASAARGHSCERPDPHEVSPPSGRRFDVWLQARSRRAGMTAPGANHAGSKSIFTTAPQPAASTGCYQRMDLVTFGDYAVRLFNERDCQ